MSTSDRLALILGRAVIRAEALQVEVEALRARLAESEQPKTGEQTK